VSSPAPESEGNALELRKVTFTIPVSGPMSFSLVTILSGTCVVEDGSFTPSSQGPFGSASPLFLISEGAAGLTVDTANISKLTFEGGCVMEFEREEEEEEEEKKKKKKKNEGERRSDGNDAIEISLMNTTIQNIEGTVKPCVI
jgi:hypothetical protein